MHFCILDWYEYMVKFLILLMRDYKNQRKLVWFKSSIVDIMVYYNLQLYNFFLGHKQASLISSLVKSIQNSLV